MWTHVDLYVYNHNYSGQLPREKTVPSVMPIIAVKAVKKKKKKKKQKILLSVLWFLH